MNEGTVAAAFLHPGEYAACFAESLADVLFSDLLGPQRIVPNGQKMAKLCSAGGIVDGRNKLTAAFLEGECEWLWFVDSDMGFAPDTLERLIESADPVERPVLGALCFALRVNGRKDYGAIRYMVSPTLYDWCDQGEAVGWLARRDYERDALQPVGATGAACVLLHRSALERIAERFGPVWWDQITHPVGPTTFSEDLSFCVRAAAVDLPVWVDTRIKTTHAKGGVFLDEDAYDRDRMVNDVEASGR